MHDKDGCRFFFFSNLIPPTGTVKKGSERSLVIALSDDRFIEALSVKLYQLTGREVRIGSMTFTVRGVKPFGVVLPEDHFGEDSIGLW